VLWRVAGDRSGSRIGHVCSGASEPVGTWGPPCCGSGFWQELRTSERDDGRGGRGVGGWSRWALGLGSAIVTVTRASRAAGARARPLGTAGARGRGGPAPDRRERSAELRRVGDRVLLPRLYRVARMAPAQVRGRQPLVASV
jgi:hypothetical protein